MNEDAVLTVDLGTGSIRVLVYSVARQETLATVARDTPVTHPEPNRAEYDAETLCATALATAAEAVRRAQVDPGRYLGITVTALRQAFVLLNAENEPLGPGVLNYDRRGAAGIPLIASLMDVDALYRLTGHWHAPELTLPKLLWFQKEEPQTWGRVGKLMFAHDWLLYRLSGEVATNATFACSGQMADVGSRSWAEDLLKDLGIRLGILPPIRETGQRLGGLVAEASREIGLTTGTPVYVGGADTQFGALGAGGMEAGSVVVVGGSTTPLMLTTSAPVFDPLRSPWVSTHLRSHLWAVETNAGHTGMIYKWFRGICRESAFGLGIANRAIDYEDLNRLAESSPLGSNGLRVVASSPRWAQDTWERRAPYSIIGFSPAHKIGDIARAIMEGVCFAVYGNIQQLERVVGRSISRLILTGGIAVAPFWAQMMADVLGRLILVGDTGQAAARAGAQCVMWGQQPGTILPAPQYRFYEPDPGLSETYKWHFEDYVGKFEKMHRCFTAEQMR